MLMEVLKIKKVLSLFENRENIEVFGGKSRETIEKLWNAENAAKEFVRFCSEFLKGKEPIPAADGPMSEAINIRPAGFMRTMQEDNHLE